MRKIIAGLFISLDGVVEAPEKWTGPYFNDQVGQAVGGLMAANDAMLLGRVTYQGFAAALPDATYRTLPGQNHMVKAQVIGPVLTEFFTTGD